MKRDYNQPSYEEMDVINLEQDLANSPVSLNLLKTAEYISNKSLGTIDTFSILRKIYEQGFEKRTERL